MDAFMVELPNRPGELARLADAIAQHGINIIACAGATYRGGGSVILLTLDTAGTRLALDEAGYAARMVELASAWVSDEPGGLAVATHRLGDAGVNIEALLPTQTVGGNVRFWFATDNPARARAALGDEVLVAWRR